MLPMAMQQRIAANKPFSQQYDPTTQQYTQSQSPIDPPALNPIQQNLSQQPQGGFMQGGKGGMPGAQQYDPTTQQYKQSQFDGFPSFMQQQRSPITSQGMPGAQQYDPTTQQYRQSQSPVAPQGGPMQGGKGGMPGAQQYSYNPATQQFSQPQGLAGLMGPQKSSLNSLQ
jgi:hypothetical protein